MQRRVLLAVAIVFSLLPGACAAGGVGSQPHNSPAAQPMEPFCGRSTEGICQSDRDCVRAGCASQVCQAITEPRQMTTCEFRECYDPDRYGMGCRCVEGACRWTPRGR